LVYIIYILRSKKRLQNRRQRGSGDSSEQRALPQESWQILEESCLKNPGRILEKNPTGGESYWRRILLAENPTGGESYWRRILLAENPAAENPGGILPLGILGILGESWQILGESCCR